MKVVKMSDAYGRQAELTRLLAKASDAYYGGGNPVMPDIEFDRLCEELAKLEQEAGFAYEASPNVTVGSASKVDALQGVKHEHPALSLDKVKYADREKLVSWAGSEDVVMSWKMDGLTVIATYDDGKLVRAATRGDGYEGKDVTHNAVYFHGLPTKIPFREHLVVRGEAVMRYDEFKKISAMNGGIYENPRNLAGATVQMLDSRESRGRRIDFHAFKLVEPKPEGVPFPEKYDWTEMEQRRLDFLSSIGFNVVEHGTVRPDGILNAVEDFRKTVASLPYPTDGIVITMNDAAEAESLGETGHHPRGSIALKWTDETKEGVIDHIHWSIGKTGVITPVAVLKEAVRLGAGSNIERASLHNLSIMSHIPKMGSETGETVRIGKGSKVEVYLANMIIPQIASATEGEEIPVPSVCPVCGNHTSIVKNNGVEVLYCPNCRCPARTMGMLENAFSKDGLNIKGLGPSQIEDLQAAKLLTTYPAEVFTLENRTSFFGGERILPDALRKMDGWGEKSWNNLLDAIDAARNTTLKRFLYALGIPMLGNDLAKKLSAYWHGDVEEFLRFVACPDKKELMALEGIADAKADSIVEWCEHVMHDAEEHLMLHILADELTFEKEETPAGASLSRMTFVITGAVHSYKNRDEFKASVETRGGKVAGSVSAKTSYLVNNDLSSATGKNQKAKELGIPIISEDEFIGRFGK